MGKFKTEPVLKKGNGLLFFAPYDLPAYRQAGALGLTVSEMAQDRLEECLQAVVSRTYSRTIEG
jgi:hypothetical protein